MLVGSVVIYSAFGARPADATPAPDPAPGTSSGPGFMDRMEVRKSAAELRAIWVLGNEYLQSAAPWSTFKEDTEKAAMQVRMGLNLIALYASLSAPFIPFTSAALAEAMNSTPGWPDDIDAALTQLPPGHAFTVPENLFAKITDEQREEWTERFKGTRA